jgi:hypothetical protein
MAPARRPAIISLLCASQRGARKRLRPLARWLDDDVDSQCCRIRCSRRATNKKKPGAGRSKRSAHVFAHRQNLRRSATSRAKRRDGIPLDPVGLGLVASLARPNWPSASILNGLDCQTLLRGSLARKTFRRAVKPFATSHTWTDAEIAQFERRWPLGTRELAFALLLYTGQRGGDVVK